MNTNEPALPDTSGAMTPPPVPPISVEQLRSDMNTIRSVLEDSDAARKPHRTIIAGGNFFCAALLLFAVPIILIVFSIPLFQTGSAGDKVAIGLVGLIPTVILVTLALPFLLAGWGLFKNKSWGTTAALVAAALNLFNLPLGTALAIYTFWAASKGLLPTSSRRE